MENLEKNMNNIEHLKKIYFWKSAFFGLIILAAGITIGGASMSIFASHKMAQKPPRPEYNNLMPRLVQSLGLQQQQINKIRPILDKYMDRLYEIREDARNDIATTLEQMNKEINPLLGDRQRNVWSNELFRIQREFSTEPRNPQAVVRRRGGAQQQLGQGAGGRMGRAGQPLNQRPNAGQRRAAVLPPPPAAPNSINENVPINEMITEDSQSNEVNE